MATKKRKWSENYVQHGFICATKSVGTQYSQCMLCNVKLSNSSLASAKLREHFTKVHGKGNIRTSQLINLSKRGRDLMPMLSLDLTVLF